MCEKMRKDECELHPFVGVINQEKGRRCIFGEPFCIAIYRSPIHGVGVFTKRSLPVNVRFGPYQGIAVNQKVYKKKPESGYAWMVEELGEEPFYVDAKDRMISNWMRVSCPHSLNILLICC